MSGVLSFALIACGALVMVAAGVCLSQLRPFPTTRNDPERLARYALCIGLTLLLAGWWLA